jgi:hypothetical protein
MAKTTKNNNDNNVSNIEYLELESVPVKIDLSDENGNEKKLPTFSMVAYTGAVFSLGYGWSGVVDLQGLQIPLQEISARFQHNANKGVGHTTHIEIKNGKVLAEGIISRETEYAEDVKTSSRNGFPWQVSMGLAPIEYQFLRAGESTQVNGKTIKGPAYIFKKMSLHEVSFVDSGADNRTSAKIRLSGDNQNLFYFNNNGDFNMTKKPVTTTTENSEENSTELNESNHQHPQQQQAVVQLSADNATQNQQQLLQQLQQSQTSLQNLQLSTESILNENRRIYAIEHYGDGRFKELELQAVQEGWTVEKYKSEYNAKAIPKAENIRMSGEQLSANNAVLEVVALRAGGIDTRFLEKQYETKTLELSDKMIGIGIQEFCALAAGNLGGLRYRNDPTEWLKLAFSSNSLPGIFSNIANKTLLEGFLMVDDTWRKVVHFGNVNNFQKHTRFRMNGSFKFEKVAPDGELKHGKLGEEQYSQQIDTYGIMFSLTRQMIINDDLGAFMDLPRSIGIGAADAINDATWEMFLDSKTDSDNKPFFDSSHKNLLTSTKLDVAGLTAAEVQFATQERSKGRPLGIPAKYLVLPIALKVQAEILMRSTILDGHTELSGNMNPHSGKFEIISSPYLQAAAFKNSSPSNWYLLADPNRLPAFEVAFLSGKQQPTVERADADFNTLGVQFRGFIDFGVAVQDYRGALKVTAPT